MVLDYEAKTFYQVSVKVVDEHGVAARSTFAVHVVDVPDCIVTSVMNSDFECISDSLFGTEGGDVIYIAGRNFGPSAIALDELGLLPSAITVQAQLQSDADAMLSAYVFDISCDIHRTAVHDNTLLRCTLPTAVSSDLGVVVKILQSGVEVATSAFFAAHISYAAPTIHSIVRSGQIVTVYGSNFGVADESNVVVGTYSNVFFTNDVTCTVQIAHTQVKCVATDCYGTAVSWSLTIGWTDN